MDTRLIEYSAAPADRNMAVDEALLASAAAGLPTLRFYGWQPAALSLGYFQRLKDRERHFASRSLPVVRRSSGGGAIVHDDELTYSIAAPLENRFRGAQQLISRVHNCLLEALGEWQISASLWPGRASGVSGQEPFLCFCRRSADDVVVDGNKVAGSAQRRHRAAVLVHGSVLLRRSPFAPEIAGLEELTGVQVGPEELARAWSGRLAATFGWKLHRSQLEKDESDQVPVLIRRRYGNEAWAAKR